MANLELAIDLSKGEKNLEIVERNLLKEKIQECMNFLGTYEQE